MKNNSRRHHDLRRVALVLSPFGRAAPRLRAHYICPSSNRGRTNYRRRQRYPRSDEKIDSHSELWIPTNTSTPTSSPPPSLVSSGFSAEECTPSPSLVRLLGMTGGRRNPQRRGQAPWRARVARNLRETLPQLPHSSIFWRVCTHAPGRQN